ncbi:MAG: pilus assembly protein PilP [Bdellovibrionaceae bacterium]|nr:pilus assembly protein PilP [Bdellovibrio sp.]
MKMTATFFSFCLILFFSTLALAAENVHEDSDGLALRDPFRLPQYIINRMKEKSMATKTDANIIDDAVEPIRRWPISSYQLVGIIWDVKRPKAMFLDKQNSIHMMQVNDRIGNGGGVLNVINNGEVIVIENKTPLKLKLKK